MKYLFFSNRIHYCFLSNLLLIVETDTSISDRSFENLKEAIGDLLPIRPF